MSFQVGDYIKVPRGCALQKICKGGTLSVPLVVLSEVSSVKSPDLRAATLIFILLVYMQRIQFYASLCIGCYICIQWLKLANNWVPVPHTCNPSCFGS
jgi:hypothetical protein